MKRLIPFLVLMTGGCVSAADGEAGGVSNDNDVPVHGAGKCDAAAVQSLVGKAASQELGAEALRLTGARTIRWLRPGDIVTMDFRGDRLNINLDEAGKVSRIHCG